MKIGGLQKLTLIDYPGKVAATVFLIGCNFRCPYCQNPELVDPKKIKAHPKIKPLEFFNFLKQRRGFLEGVCITGGEPTIHQDLPSFIRRIKKLNFLVKLDTNGSNPKMLKKLIDENLVDFIAMDIKTSLSKYNKVGYSSFKTSLIQKSVEIIKESGKEYEFRITVVPKIVTQQDIKLVSQWLKGVKKIALQQFEPDKVLDPVFKKIKPYSLQELQKMLEILKSNIDNVELRAQE